jgi:putative phage-type endonuclease
MVNADRSKFLGGSDWVDVLGLEPYGCKRKAVYEKRGTSPDYERVVTPEMTRGTRLEDIIADLYIEKVGLLVIRRTKFAHQELPEWWGGSIDRAIARSPDGPGVLECKTLGERAWHRFKRGGLPDYYVCQMQHYLALTGYKWGEFACLWTDGWQFEHFMVKRDDALIDMMKETGDIFWRHVEHGPDFDRLDATDKRCGRCQWRLTCQGAVLNAIADKSSGDEFEVDYTVFDHDDALEPLLALRLEYREILDDAEAELDKVNEQITGNLLQRKLSRVQLPGVKVLLFTEQVRRSIDWPAVDKAEPGLEKRLKEQFSRETRVKPSIRVYPI